MEIIIGYGIDSIVFGMSQAEVISILGEPDKISETEREQAIVYTYNNRFIKLGFDQEDNFILGSIEVHNPETTFLNQKIISWEKGKIKEFLISNGFSKFEYEEYDYFEELFCEDIFTYFEFEFNRVKSIKFYPLADNNGDFIWPDIHK